MENEAYRSYVKKIEERNTARSAVEKAEEELNTIIQDLNDPKTTKKLKEDGLFIQKVCCGDEVSLGENFKDVDAALKKLGVRSFPKRAGRCRPIVPACFKGGWEENVQKLIGYIYDDVFIDILKHNGWTVVWWNHNFRANNNFAMLKSIT